MSTQLSDEVASMKEPPSIVPESTVPEDGAAKEAQSTVPLPDDDTDNNSKETVPDAEQPEGVLVEWGENDVENPRYWSRRNKWILTVTVSCITFVSPAASSMVAPADRSIGLDLNITASFEQQIVISIYILGYAVGPLMLGPLSEIYGRKWVVQITNALFLIFNLACGFSQNKTQLIVFRFFSGLAGSAPLSVGGGILSDIWSPTERARAFAIYSLCPVLGPSVGPIAGGFIAQYSTWRWAFWAISIFDGFILAVAVFYLKETYAPVLLKQRAKRLEKETGTRHYTQFDDKLTFTQRLETNLVRPFKLLFTQPIIQFLTVYMAFLYGLLYLVLTTYPRLWNTVYNENSAIGGLNYISISIGYTVGAQVAAVLVDMIYKRLKAKNNGVGRPEFRIPLMLYTCFILPAGLMWYGWSAQKKLHWIMPNIGALILCFGIIITYNCIQLYAIDSYGRFSASALAAIAVIRSLCGFGFPLFAPYMYDSLGYGWGNSLMAFIALGIGIVAPTILWKYGAQMRARSPYAAERTPT